MPAASLLQRVFPLERGLAIQERLAPAEAAALQGQLLRRLLGHAHARSPFWRARLEGAGVDLAGPVGLAALGRLPVLTRGELQDHFEAMRAPGPGLGAIATASTSGSTGRPVRVEYGEAARMDMLFAMARRWDAWHGRDVTRRLAVIADVEDGTRAGWRPDLVAEGRVGEAVSRNMMASTAGELWDWLAGQEAAYLTATVSIVRALAEEALADLASTKGAERRVRLAQVMTYGEVVTDETRRRVAEAFGGARVASIYGCQEASWMALECPVHEGRLHVMGASCIVEVVRPDGAACAAGEAGRVLVTALHSHAMPLVRYEVGDIAEWGPGGAEGGACDCGVVGPALGRVWGRERSFLRMADGNLRLARITGGDWREIAPVQEARLVQYGDGLVEAFVRCPRLLTPEERAGLEAMLRRVLDPGLAVMVSQVEAIDWPASGKREDITRLDRLRGGDAGGG